MGGNRVGGLLVQAVPLRYDALDGLVTVHTSGDLLVYQVLRREPGHDHGPGDLTSIHCLEQFFQGALPVRVEGVAAGKGFSLLNRRPRGGVRVDQSDAGHLKQNQEMWLLRRPARGSRSQKLIQRGTRTIANRAGYG
jgi:hypothetical protein